MTNIKEVLRLVKEDGDVIAEATKDGDFWELQITFATKESVLEYLAFLDQEYDLAVQPDFPTILETAKDCYKAPVGSRWICESDIEYERKQDAWYYRSNILPDQWMRVTGTPFEGNLPLTYLEPEA